MTLLVVKGVLGWVVALAGASAICVSFAISILHHCLLDKCLYDQEIYYLACTNQPPRH
jgi:hypothetical protein